MNMRRRLTSVIVPAIILAVVGVGAFFTGRVSTGQEALATPSVPTSTYSLLDGAVAFDTSRHFIINFEPFRNQLNALQTQYQAATPGEMTYFYLDYLNNAATISLNSRNQFTAASTIKVPLAMALYKMAEEGKLNMSDTYTLEQANLDSRFGTLYNAGPNQTFTIEQLVSIMLEKSDNTAMNALITILDRVGITNPFQDVYTQMGWSNAPTADNINSYINIDVHTLTNMFLALYNATYDNPVDSQKILNYLTQTPFNTEIVAGVSPDIMVAHKIGVADPNDTYSDCGIVYAPERPYIICVGVSGVPEQTADTIIADMSKTAYQYVINN